MYIFLAFALITSTSALIYAYRDSHFIKGPVTVYQEIFNFKRQQCPPNTHIDLLKLHAKTTGTILSTACSLGSKVVLEKLFGPARKANGTLLISYYHAGTWKYALTKSSVHPSPIVEVLGETKPNPPIKSDTITHLVSILASEDYATFRIRPVDLGYDAVIITLSKNQCCQSSTLRVESYDDIGAAVRKELRE